MQILIGFIRVLNQDSRKNRHSSAGWNPPPKEGNSGPAGGDPSLRWNDGARCRDDKLKKLRLDELVLARDMAPSRARAQAQIMAGNVLVNDVPVTKSGTMVSEDVALRFKKIPDDYASRGAYKLLGALAAFPVQIQNQVLLDVGQSTGGFTDALLQAGAKTVIGVDVGYGQLHAKLRSDPRVWCIERCNARELTRETLVAHAQRHKPARDESLVDQINGFVMDVSFISISKVLPALKALLSPAAWGLVLIKPQFEAAPNQVESGGIIRNKQVVWQVVLGVYEQLLAQGWQVLAMCPAAITGSDGNQEFLVWMKT